eukprot:gb/GECG01010409.1/.p1 GENE.gb/GECG01010409.1/~~gb/GECG01010409.1/.p1  ORF type:complete len:102 (+),score=6.89 gb/GECG01010409.1/:1-306(+)
MVQGSIFHTTVINFYRNMVMFGHRRGIKSYCTGLMSGVLLLTYLSKVQQHENHYTREKTSDFYKENFSERYDNPVFKLPAYENGEHTHELRGLAKKKAEHH